MSRLRTLLCVVLYGRHEFHLAWTQARLFQRCARCGHETPGWHVPPALRFRSTWMR